jgi:hypothetical protein
MRRTARSARTLACFGVLAAALAVATPALASSRTTAPGQHAIVGVTITDKAITVLGNSQEARGVIATFLANNLGKKPHNFTIFGKKTKTIMPGHQARFTVTLTFRGQFPYRSTLDKGKKAFRGIFTVY